MGKINETMESRSQAHVSFHRQPWMPSYAGMDQSGYNMGMSSSLAATGYMNTAGSQLQRKKSSAVVKVDQTVLEKVPTLNPIEMMRILDARNVDMGLH
jgi:hypothetical protein